jgi:hypothetical protein
MINFIKFDFADFQDITLHQKAATACVVLLSLYKGISHQNYFAHKGTEKYRLPQIFVEKKATKNELVTSAE